MKSNYKMLGDYIEPVNRRNIDGRVTDLRGLSLTKEFRSSTSNIVGTDMSTYKIMHKHEFAANFMGLGVLVDKAAIVLKTDDQPNIVSGAYPVFRVRDETRLHPKYLMMWLIRSEFDRFCVFKSDRGIRGGFDWSDLLEVQLPIPHIDKQREIVKEYNTIQNRIALNQQLIQKLEETAQAIYRQWFVEGIDLENLPEGWEMGTLNELVEFKNGKSKPSKAGSYPVYGGNGIIEFVNEYNSENVIPIGRVGAYCGSLHRELGKCWISDNAISAKSKMGCNMFAYYLLNDLKLNEKSEGTGQPLITQGLLNSVVIAKPSFDSISQFEAKALKIFTHQDLVAKENQKLIEMKELLLSKLATVED